MKPTIRTTRIATTRKPRKVRMTISRSGCAEKIRANATSSAPYSELTVQTRPMTARNDVNAAPSVIASSAPLIRSSRGGKALISVSATVARTAGSPVNQPATPSTSMVVGIAANNDENASPLDSSPPAAAPNVSRQPDPRDPVEDPR
jgi:hypothetical protein